MLIILRMQRELMTLLEEKIQHESVAEITIIITKYNPTILPHDTQKVWCYLVCVCVYRAPEGDTRTNNRVRRRIHNKS